MTVDQAFARYFEEIAKGTKYGERTQRYTFVLLSEALGGNALLSSLTDDRISRLVQHFRTRKPRYAGLSVGVSPATCNRYVTTLSVVCRRAREVWGIEVGPWEKAKHVQKEPSGREVFLEYEQARALLDNLCGHARPIVMFDLATGLRRGNALAITWEQISLDLGRAVLIQKGGRPLSIALVPAVVELLRSVQPDADKRSGPVWTFGNPHTPCTCSHCRPKRNHGKPVLSIKRAFASAVRNAGLADEAAGRVRFHDLRHTFASWLLAQQGNLVMVKEALGHTDIKTTSRYSHLLPGAKAQAIAGAVAGLLAPPLDKKEKA
jgi:integrase